MLKRILILIIVFILTVLPLSACFDGEPDIQTHTDSTAEPTDAETEEVVLHSFYATGSMHVAYPKEGEDEKSSWLGLYLPDRLVNGELRPNINEGETVKIVYDGEITAHEKESYGVIQNLHSITLVNDPRSYSGIDYGVAVMQPMPYGYDKIAAAEANVSLSESEFPMFLAKSASELVEYANTYFFAKPVFSGNYSEEQIENTMRWHDRLLLLSDYNDEFFAKNDLIMLFIESGSGSARYDVTDIVSQDGVLTIDITMTKGYLTCDMSNWIFFISVPKNVTAETAEYKNTYTIPENVSYKQTAIRYGYISGGFRYKALNYTGEDQAYYTPWLFKAESVDELKAIFELMRNPSGINSFRDDNSEKAYNSLYGSYDAGFFEDNVLIVIYRAASSGGDAFTVSSVTTADNTLTIGISQTEYGVTEDMSGWLFRIAIPKATVKNITSYIAE